MRCGGRYFTKSLSKTYGLKYYHEPLKEIKDDNSVVKYLTKTKSIDRLCDLLKDADHVFLLDRRDLESQLESTVSLYYKQKDWNLKWIWDESLIHKEMYNPLRNDLIESSKTLEMVSKQLNIPIIYYEDLYYNTQSVDLQGLTFEPDLSDKLRIKNTSKKLI